MSDEFHLDIDKALENAKTTDLNGFTKDVKPDALETVRKSLQNCEQLCGLDRKTVALLLQGEFHQYETLNSVGRSSKKIVIEYDINQKKENE
tara:strand:+ start:373 stop:648 length:276 start_codon:yes stop_codon:yes gene_type:complete